MKHNYLKANGLSWHSDCNAAFVDGQGVIEELGHAVDGVDLVADGGGGGLAQVHERVGLGAGFGALPAALAIAPEAKEAG